MIEFCEFYKSQRGRHKTLTYHYRGVKWSEKVGQHLKRGGLLEMVQNRLDLIHEFLDIIFLRNLVVYKPLYVYMLFEKAHLEKYYYYYYSDRPTHIFTLLCP